MLHRGIYDPSVGEAGLYPPRGEGTDLRREIERLQADLSRYRGIEQQLVDTLLSATSHAAVIRESARRDAELMLRKARAEVERRKAAAEQERRELLRIRRITEQTKRGLAGLLTAKLEELQLDAQEEPPLAGQEPDLAAALERGLQRDLHRTGSSESRTAAPEPQPRDQLEQGSTGASAADPA